MPENWRISATEMVDTLFSRMIRVWPEGTQQLCALQATLIAELWGHPREGTTMETREKRLERIEREKLAKHQSDAQNYCDRISSIIRGLAHVARYDFPELAEGFYRVSEDAAGLLVEYKNRLGIRDGLSEDEARAELAMSAE